MKKLLLILVSIVIGWQLYNYSGQVTIGPGVFAPDSPKQTADVSFKNLRFDDYNIKGLAKFYVKAKVLSRENYYFGREADLSPTDLALGWGRMSDESVLESIDISQSGRFYMWRTDLFPIPRREIETHSANMHLIPANDDVKSAINRAKQGDIVEISGDLVYVESIADGWYWKSSQTRNDVGDGACELILVNSFKIVTP